MDVTASTPPPANNVTRMLQEAGEGRADSARDLLPVVYAQLRAIAQQRMAGERKDHTLQATALVHEAYLKLVGEGQPINWSGRAAFFKAAAEAMRRILIDHARSKGRDKRGGAEKRDRVPLSMVDLAIDGNSEKILALDEAICRLESEDAEVAQVVRLRFFAGLSVDDTAAALNTSPRSVDRMWSYARAWLYQALNQLQD